MCIVSIYEWAHTQIHIRVKINFIKKPIKNKVSYNFAISLFFRHHEVLSVGKLYSLVVDFLPSYFPLSVSPPLTEKISY